MAALDSTEVWKLIPGYTYYEVSTQGRVRSLSRITRRWHGRIGRHQDVPVRGRVLTPTPRYSRRGRPPSHAGVRLCEYGVSVEERVHHLVLVTFVGPCPDGMEGCHNDGNPLNNRLDNLRWDTHRANVADSKRHGTASAPPHRFGEAHHMATLTSDQIRAIREPIYRFGLHAELSRQYGVSDTTIYRIRKGLSRTFND